MDGLKQEGLQKRQPGNLENYEKQADKTFRCKNCGATIMAVEKVVDLKWIQFVGMVETKKLVPFCPNCDAKP
jgi:DNA-directed RNA polymerase subunit RPC12/RpoP